MLGCELSGTGWQLSGWNGSKRYALRRGLTRPRKGERHEAGEVKCQAGCSKVAWLQLQQAVPRSWFKKPLSPLPTVHLKP